MGADEDEEIVKAASGAVAMLTSISTKLCSKIFESTQWEACMLNILANKDFEVTYRGVVIVDNMVQCGKEVAEPLMDTQIMDVCQALIAKANLDLGNSSPSDLLQKIEDCRAHPGAVAQYGGDQDLQPGGAGGRGRREVGALAPGTHGTHRTQGGVTTRLCRYFQIHYLHDK